MADTDLAVLAQLPIFRGLKDAHLSKIAASARRFHFQPGEDLTREGTSGGRMYVILSGEVEVVHGEATLATLGAGQSVGEIAMIDGQPRSADVRATSQVEALGITSWNFRPLLAEHPEVAIALIEALCQRIRNTNPNT